MESGGEHLVERELLPGSKRLSKDIRAKRAAHGHQRDVALGKQRPGLGVVYLAIRLFRQPE